MGDVRFNQPLERLMSSDDRVRELASMADEDVIQALAAASHSRDALLANVLATEALNRVRRSRTAIRHLGEGVLTADAEGRVTSVNPAAERLLGFSAEELVGRDMHETIHSHDHHGRLIPRSACDVLRVLRTGEVVEREDDVYVRKDGSTFFVAYTSAPILAGGEVVGLVTAFRDVTERREQEARFRRSEQHSRTLHAAVPVMAMTLGADLRIQGANDRLAATLGYAQEELQGASAVDLYAPDAREAAQETLRTVLERGGAEQRESWKLRKDGSRTRVAETITRGLDSDGQPRLVVLCEGIATRKPREAALAESRQRLVNIAESADGMVTLDLQGNVLDASLATTNFTGYLPEETRGHAFTEYVAPHDLRRVWDLFERIATGEALRTELNVLHRSGSLVPVRATGMPIHAGGEVVGVHAVLQDLTEERRAYDLRAQLTEAALDAIVTIDGAGMIVDWNPAAEKIFGYRSDEALGRDMGELIVPPRFRAAHAEGLRRAVATRGQRQVARRYELPALRKDGSEFDAEISITSVPSAQPRFTGFVRDVTTQRAVEAAARKRARQHAVVSLLGMEALRGAPLQVVFNHAVEELKGVLQVDSTTILQLDPNGASLTLRAGYGWPSSVRAHETHVSAGSESQAGFTLVAEDPVVVEDLGEEERFHGLDLLREHGVRSGISVVVQGVDGPWGVLGIHARVRRTFSDDEVGFVQSVANVLAGAIQRRQTEESLERRVAERTRSLAEATRDLQTFTNSASHDLRAPIRGVDALLSAVLEDYGGVMPADARELVERALREDRRASRLVQDILGFARSVQNDLRPEPVDLTRLVREITQEVDAQHPERSTDWDIEEDMRVRADVRLLRVALQNLLDNAAKYSSRAPEPRVEVQVSHKSGMAVVSVRDNGVGFDPSESHRLFQPFHRLASSHGFEGTGLGLATAHRIAQRHGGCIEAHGEPGRGATIRLVLPEGA